MAARHYASQPFLAGWVLFGLVTSGEAIQPTHPHIGAEGSRHYPKSRDRSERHPEKS